MVKFGRGYPVIMALFSAIKGKLYCTDQRIFIMFAIVDRLEYTGFMLLEYLTTQGLV